MNSRGWLKELEIVTPEPSIFGSWSSLWSQLIEGKKELGSRGVGLIWWPTAGPRQRSTHLLAISSSTPSGVIEESLPQKKNCSISSLCQRYDFSEYILLGSLSQPIKTEKISDDGSSNCRFILQFICFGHHGVQIQGKYTQLASCKSVAWIACMNITF